MKAKSVIATAILHGILNGTFGISFMLVAGRNDLLTGMTGLAGFITLLMVNVILFYYDRTLGHKSLINKKLSLII
ncbi:MAG: hypothetical protein ACOC3T_05700 [Bacteroidota bacterium]